MDVSSIPIMEALKKRMHWLNTNQSVLSENIANADTPGYVNKELEKQDFSNLVRAMGSGGDGAPQAASATQLKTNNTRHIGSAGSAGGDARLKDSKGNEEALNGNSVVLEEEMLKLADNQMEYGMAVNLYKKNMQLLKIAMGKGGGR